LEGTRRVYLNISQEGKDDIDDLRESGLINGLKLSSSDYQSVTAYQISSKGTALLHRIPEELMKQVDEKISVNGELLTVHWDGKEFTLNTPSGFIKKSTITETEDVSYVSSPFLPTSLRFGSTKRLADNSHRAKESANGASSIRDDTLTEVISLDDGKYINDCGDSVAIL
jgi:WD repeat-containing protein 35